jgi:predicted secreted protein
MSRKLFCLAVGFLFVISCLTGCAGNKGTSPSPSMSTTPMTTASPAVSPSPGTAVTPEQAAQVIGETPEKVFMENELQGTTTAGMALAIALPEDTGTTWEVTVDDGVEELPDGTVNTTNMASDGQGGTSPSPGGSPAGSPAGSPGTSPAGSPGASPGGSPMAGANYHVWGFKITDKGDYNIKITDTNNAAAEKTYTITVQSTT